jgi:hypothetical protein
LELADTIKEKLVDSFTCILHGLADTPHKDSLIPIFPKLMHFFIVTDNKALNPTVVRPIIIILIKFERAGVLEAELGFDYGHLQLLRDSSGSHLQSAKHIQPD